MNARWLNSVNIEKNPLCYKLFVSLFKLKVLTTTFCYYKQIFRILS